MTLALTLQQALDQLARPRPMPLPDVPRCVEAVARATRGLADGGEPPDLDLLSRLVARFRDASRRGVLNQFAAREWNEVAWGIWLDPEPLAENDAFLQALLARLRSGSRRFCRRLILAYLTAFDATKESFRRVGRELLQVVHQWAWDWTERQQRFALFEPDRGPDLIARACLYASRLLSDQLADAGISRSRRFEGMEAAAFKEALSLLQAALEADRSDALALLDRVLDWAMYEGHLAFPKLRAPLAEALLLPWRSATPRNETRERITDFLLRHLKDPRIEPINWHGVDDEALRVIRRWLTRVALEQFLQVVDKVAEIGHWRYRRAFLMTYYEAGFIEEAWVVFAPGAERIGAWRLRELAGYGRLNNPRNNTHCVLLMRLTNDITVAEISHVGKCRIWLPGIRSTPPLYRKVYDRGQIEAQPNFEFCHWNPERLQWQTNIARFLADNAGLHVANSKFRPS